MARTRRSLGIGIAVWLLVAACSDGEPPQPIEVEEAPRAEAETGLPVERNVDVAWPEIGNWGLRDSLEVDLDGDGSAERILLAAAAERDARGRPMWDDGQRWAVAVIDRNEIPTLLFEGFVQLGRLDVAVLDAEGRVRLLITESGSNGQTTWEIGWSGSGEAAVLGRVGGALRSPEGRIRLPD